MNKRNDLIKIMNRLPDEALPELWETLGQMVEFYSSRAATEHLAHEERIIGEVVAREERPDFFLDWDQI